MTRLILLLAAVFVGMLVLTFLVHKITKRNKFIKYLPAAILLIFSIYFYRLATNSSYSGLQDIGRTIIALMFLVGSAAGLLCSMLIDFRRPKPGR